MKIQVIGITICALLCLFRQNSEAFEIDAPTASELFEVRKVVMSQDNVNSSFETGSMNYWSTVYGDSEVTNEIVAADGDYYAKLTSQVTVNRADSRIDTYYTKNVTTAEYGNIFKISFYLYFPGAVDNYKPTDSMQLHYGINNGNNWMETLINKSIYLSDVETNQWYYYEFYAQTTQAVFTGISPRVACRTYSNDTNSIYVLYVDGLKVEQGGYKKIGTVVFIR